jgi:hypothetical protein
MQFRVMNHRIGSLVDYQPYMRYDAWMCIMASEDGIHWTMNFDYNLLPR